MSLAIFDLDNTLLGGDSDHAWGEFLIAEGLVDAATHAARNDAFYQQYTRGSLDIDAYVRFTLGPVLHLTLSELADLHARYMRQHVEPMVLPAALQLLDRHRSQGDYCLIISATNSFITTPIARRLGVDHLLSTDLEVVDARYSGRILGVPCFQGGKVTRLQQWLAEDGAGFSLTDATFYSDSANDLPLLETVPKPVAVDPDERLRTVAEARGWPVISLR